MSADALSRAFLALADPVRRDLVARLAEGDAAVGDLAAPYAITLQAVSKHLKVLEAAGLVSRRRDGQRRPVHLELGAFEPVAEWLERHRQRAEARYARLDALLAALPPSPPGAASPGTASPGTVSSGTASPVTASPAAPAPADAASEPSSPPAA